MSTKPLRSLLLPLLLVACAPEPGPGNPIGGDEDTGPQAGVPGNDDTSFPPGDRASIMLTRILQTDGTQLVELQGLVVDNNQGYINAAHCALADTHCISVLPPAEDDFVNLPPNSVFEPGLSEYGYFGLDFTLGPWRSHYVNDGETFPHYYSDLTPKYSRQSIYGWHGLRLDGTWGKYRGEHDIYVSPEFQLITPQANTTIDFNDTDTLLFQWVPDGNGMVFLTVFEEGIAANVQRLYMLHDDGYFQLPVKDLGLGSSDRAVHFSMARWNTNTLNIRGNTVDIIATSEVRFKGNYSFVDGRDRLEPGDTCAEASILPGLQPGRYWGRLGSDGFVNDINNIYTPSGLACTGFQVAGQDAFHPIDLNPYEAVMLRYRMPSSDSAIYLLRDCSDNHTCLDGHDLGGHGVWESVSYLNTSDKSERIYVGLDSYVTNTGTYELDVEFEQLIDPPMRDTCIEAMQDPPFTTGTYPFYSSFVAFTPGSDPGQGGCTGKAEPGPDAMIPVQLGPGETLTATIDMPGTDPALYLVWQCQLPASSCAAGADANIGLPNETLVFKNNGGTAQNMYLVIDTSSGNGLREYTLRLDIR